MKQPPLPLESTPDYWKILGQPDSFPEPRADVVIGVECAGKDASWLRLNRHHLDLAFACDVDPSVDADLSKQCQEHDIILSCTPPPVGNRDSAYSVESLLDHLKDHQAHYCVMFDPGWRSHHSVNIEKLVGLLCYISSHSPIDFWMTGSWGIQETKANRFKGVQRSKMALEIAQRWGEPMLSKIPSREYVGKHRGIIHWSFGPTCSEGSVQCLPGRGLYEELATAPIVKGKAHLVQAGGMIINRGDGLTRTYMPGHTSPAFMDWPERSLDSLAESLREHTAERVPTDLSSQAYEDIGEPVSKKSATTVMGLKKALNPHFKSACNGDEKSRLSPKVLVRDKNGIDIYWIGTSCVLRGRQDSSGIQDVFVRVSPGPVDLGVLPEVRPATNEDVPAVKASFPGLFAGVVAVEDLHGDDQTRALEALKTLRELGVRP